MEKSFQRSALLVTLSLFFFSIPVSLSVPFVLFHGFGGECSNDKVSNLTQFLINHSGYPGTCVEIGDGVKDSLFMPLRQQASIACEKIKQMPELSEGYNIVAESQGNLVARGLIEFCDNAPPVINYVSLGGPHAGVAAIPEGCDSAFCILMKAFFAVIYSDFAQDHTAPSGYVKKPMEIKNYLEHSKYLPKLNNERPGEKNSTFKDRFTSLQNLVLIMFQNDTILVPRETSWFGYYPDGASSSTPVLPPQKTKLYTEDWIGLKTLDDAGKVRFISVPGGHIEITEEDLVKYVVPYLQNESLFSSEHETI
ncbi:alpha/beta-Hydrolases superfamily protein [Arabidopsis thaliana]|jgi:palmitoyl-protein thioesterase|uniref:Alpha/beta-Hydrolases superfamily protein n=2 Tax=Arabidopsis thaliana TaxID=3702 RepID=Q501G7_ARATH|nr:alpha/beta-Hydrolases superfamily protein [Arabidopsis thaliana]NP_001190753.1 alpha/beta-Hydrolases superfamily protein [Arabidopsis thaliana]NP_001319975.1 alpha/beta-Hydrolases superfamily protein [Arabidopsis thaliana]NP_193477.1 alpha/beta-Hydrolases superfamily protein [Arabidopsis thaliana]AAY25412.1 At4g17470 [Arabidopsis thaliana]AEE83895.1 alpha/beta-Hydrolases superfamily protein [Arabidopsis thaliana]AEE83896.1 alpha/beta-Hydrolases superfamily protein [Arabidopsis thaliana]AE|eukprot:NP_001190752.1 alpha/beta-Hydrolases superfamily protein [Arabidopsis thaliana]